MSKHPNDQIKSPAPQTSSPEQPAKTSRYEVVTWAELREKYGLPDDGGYLVISPVPRVKKEV